MGCCLQRDKYPCSPFSDQTTQSQIHLYESIARMIQESEEKKRIELLYEARQLASLKYRDQLIAEYRELRRNKIKSKSGILEQSALKIEPRSKSQILNASCPMPRNVLNSYKYNQIIKKSQLNQNINPQEVKQEQQIQTEPISQPLSQSEEYTTSSELVEIPFQCIHCSCQIIENILALPCQHYFHEQCFTQMVQKQINDDVLIPVCQCGAKLKSINIRQSLSADIFDKYLQKQSDYLQQISNI